MRIEVTIHKVKKQPAGAEAVLQTEPLRWLSQNYVTIRRAGFDGLSALGGADGDKRRVEKTRKAIWERADYWVY